MAAFIGSRRFSVRLRLLSLLITLATAGVLLFLWTGRVTSTQAIVVGDVGLVQPGISGRVARVVVGLGDTVAAGDVLVELEANKIWLDLEALQARRDGAEARLKAITPPPEEPSTATSKKKKKAPKKPANLDALQEDFAVLETQVAALEEEIEQYRLRSPVAGVVRFVEDGLMGRWVSPGERLMEVGGENLRVRAWFPPERVFGLLEPGMLAKLDIAGTQATVVVSGVGGVEAAGLMAEFTAADERILQAAGHPCEVTLETRSAR